MASQTPIPPMTELPELPFENLSAMSLRDHRPLSPGPSNPSPSWSSNRRRSPRVPSWDSLKERAKKLIRKKWSSLSQEEQEEKEEDNQMSIAKESKMTQDKVKQLVRDALHASLCAAALSTASDGSGPTIQDADEISAITWMNYKGI
ncbi:hypothetical protein FRC11_010974, partial [Ceratobasidium sp. 423]